MKSFMRKLALALALVLSIATFAPAAGVQAASKPKLNTTKKTIWVGGKIFDFNVVADNLSDYRISYSTTDPDMLKVDSRNGKVRALSVGNDATTTLIATLTEKATGKVSKLSATVYIKESASKVEIVNKELADEILPIGKEVADFDSVMYNKNGDKSGIRKEYVTDYRQWTSSDTSVATIDKNGRVTTHKPGTAVLTVSTYVKSDYSDANGPTAKDSVTITVGNSVSEIRQESLNKIAIQFNADVSKELKQSDITVVDKNTLIRQDIKSLTFSKDGKTAYLEMYLDLVNQHVYEITFGDTKESFTARVGEVSSVVVHSDSITYGQPTEIKVSLFDANGIDVTTETNLANLEITSDYGYYDAVNGTLILFNVGDRATITAVYHTYSYDSTGSEITYTGKGSFVAVDAAPVSLKNLKLNVGTAENWNHNNMFVALNDTNFRLFAKATFSDDSTKTNAELRFESTDTNKLLIDDTGLLVPIGTGTVIVKIMDNNQVIGTATVTIRAARKASSVSLDNPVVKLSKDVAADLATVTMQIRDQYGDKMAVDAISVTQTNTTTAPALVNLSADGDTVSLNGGMFSVAGVYRYEIKDTVSGKTQVLTVNVVTPSEAKSYRVVIDNVPKDILYVNGDTADMNVGIKLFSYDASGNKVASVTGGYGYTITKAGETESATVTPFSGTDTFAVRSEEDGKISFFDGSYIVKVYQTSDGSTKEGLVTTAQFTITNTQPVPTVTQDKKTITSGDAAAIAAGTPDSLTKYFTINANGAAGTLTVESASARQIGTTLLVESITIRESFADGNYIAHTIEKNFTLSVR